DRQSAGQGRLPLLRPEALRVARRFARLAHHGALRAKCCPGRDPPERSPRVPGPRRTTRTAGRRPAQRAYATLLDRRARNHRLPGRTRHHQRHQRARQGAPPPRTIRGELITPMLYLDNAATSFPKPEVVYQTLDRFARTQLANPGRSSHRMAKEAERTIDNARLALNRLFNGEGPERWIFTLNCTDGLNLAIKGSIEPGDHVITSDLEHNSVSRPLRALEKAGTITLTRLASDQGYLDPDDVRRALTPRTKLVALTHAANVLGTVQDIAAIAAV